MNSKNIYKKEEVWVFIEARSGCKLKGFLSKEAFEQICSDETDWRFLVSTVMSSVLGCYICALANHGKVKSSLLTLTAITFFRKLARHTEAFNDGYILGIFDNVKSLVEQEGR